MKTGTDLEGIFSVNVIVHRQHGYMKAGQEDAAEDPLLFLVCKTKPETDTVIHFALLLSINFKLVMKSQ